MKILHVVPYFYPAWGYGGPPKAVYEIAKNQVLLGHDVHVLTTTAFERDELLPSGRVNIDGIKVTRLPNISNFVMWKFHFCTPVGVKDFLRNHEFDCVHLHEVRTLLNYFSLQNAKTREFVISPWGTLPYNDSRIFIKRFFDKVLLKNLETKILVSFAQTDHETEVIKRFAVSKQVVLIPLGIDFREFSHLPSQLEARKQLGLDINSFYFLFLGRFSPHKGLRNVLLAFNKVRLTFPRARLLLVGRDDGYLKQVLKLIKLNDLSSMFRSGYI